MVDLRQAYAFACNLVRSGKLTSSAARAGHRLVWVKDGAFGARILSARPDDYLIVGSHAQCGLVLPNDEWVALRHLMVRSVVLPSGGSALRVLDLHSNNGFGLIDGSRQTSIFAEGPVAVAVGAYALVGLPPETADDRLPQSLPEPSVDRMRAPTPQAAREQLAAIERSMSPYRANARPNQSSRITLMPQLVMIGEALPPRLGRLATGGKWGITLEREGRSATLTVADDDLLGGVVIGRSEKCYSEMLRRITDAHTSRVHVLLLREGDRIFAYDLASTHGTYKDGVAIGRVMLSDAGTTLSLGRGEGAVRMHWHRVVT